MLELIYSIDNSHEQNEVLLIKIQEAEKDGFVFKPIELQRSLNREILNKLATARDHTILTLLIQEEIAYTKRWGKVIDEKKMPFNNIHVSQRAIPELLKLFAMAGKLYFNRKSLVIDLYSKVEFYYLVDSSCRGNHSEGFLKTGLQDFPLHTCDFLWRGSPHWFIRGNHLKLLSTEVSWKDLKNSFERQSRSIEDLVEEAKKDIEAPKVIFKNELVFTPKEPFPILILKDRSGAFADLLMDYGENSRPILYQESNTHTFENSGKIYCKRIPRLESAWEKDLLETDFIKKITGSSHYYCPIDKVAKSLTFLLEIGWKIRDYKDNYVSLLKRATLHAETKDNTVFIKGKIDYETFQADIKDVIGAFNKRERFAQVSLGHVILLPENLEEVGLDELINGAELINDAVKIRRSQVGTLLGLFKDNPEMTMDRTLTSIKEELSKLQDISKIDMGNQFIGTLRPYQQEGLNWLAFLYKFGFHGILADDMGLGKTVQVIAFISQLQLEFPILVVVPTSLIFNWKQEINRFFPLLQVTVHHGSKRSQIQDPLRQAKLILTSYTTLRLDFALFSNLHYQCVILDEAQAIKNAHSQIFQTITQLSARFRLSITGTPIENNLLELWSHFRFLIPDLLGESETFALQIRAAESDSRFLKHIKKKIRPFFLRRKKEDVAKDLPEKIEETVWIEMSVNQRKIYEEFLISARRGLLRKVELEGIGKHRIEILETILRLRQICCHPWLVSNEGLSESSQSAKLEILIRDLETIIEEERKVLVFSQFTSMLSLISKEIAKKGWEFLYLDGSTQNREQVVTSFQENRSTSVFLISLKAGGIGLNLTAADYVILFDPWWNQAVENQAIDRAHRIGRKDTVIARRYILIDTIEEKIMKLKAAKAALAEDLFEEEGIPQSLNLEDLLFLLT